MNNEERRRVEKLDGAGIFSYYWYWFVLWWCYGSRRVDELIGEYLKEKFQTEIEKFRIKEQEKEAKSVLVENENASDEEPPATSSQLRKKKDTYYINTDSASDIGVDDENLFDDESSDVSLFEEDSGAEEDAVFEWAGAQSSGNLSNLSDEIFGGGGDFGGGGAGGGWSREDTGHMTFTQDISDVQEISAGISGTVNEYE